MSSPIALTTGDLALAALLVLLNGVVSLALDLGLGRRLILSATRAVLQLLLLGVVLEWVFDSDQKAVVLLLLVAMAVLAGVEAVRRTTRRVRGALAGSTLVMLTGSLLVAFYALRVVIDVEPWWTPR